MQLTGLQKSVSKICFEVIFAPFRDGDEGREFMIECSERFLSIGDAVVNGYKEDQDLASTHYLHAIKPSQFPTDTDIAKIHYLQSTIH